MLWCRLPSGRQLAYVSPQVDVGDRNRDELSHMTVDSYTHKWARRRTYGGMLTENVVQAVARDILVRAIYRLDAEGYDVVMHVHDECVVESGSQARRPAAMESIMSETPAWCIGCPIACEGFSLCVTGNKRKHTMQFNPHAYQREAIDFLVRRLYLEGHTGAGLFLDCGLGKTAITLSAIQALRDVGEVRRTWWWRRCGQFIPSGHRKLTSGNSI